MEGDAAAGTQLVSTGTCPSKQEVKLPKNAIEHIVTAIEKCDIPYPTAQQVAAYIRDTVSAYHETPVDNLTQMVLHHLGQNPMYFMPVRTAGQASQDPATYRWGLNRQIAAMAVDSSCFKRRYHPYQSRGQHSGSHHGTFTTATVSPGVVLSHSATSVNKSTYSAASGGYPALSSYQVSAGTQYGPTVMHGMGSNTVLSDSRMLGSPLPSLQGLSSSCVYNPSAPPPPVPPAGFKAQNGLAYYSMCSNFSGPAYAAVN